MRPTSPKPLANSVLDLAGELVGSVDGPTDLATNPKHFAAYGQRTTKAVRGRLSSATGKPSLCPTDGTSTTRE